MAKTVNSYVSDQGEVSIDISAGNVSAISAFTTSETVVLDGAVRSFRRTNNPQRQYDFTRVTGDTSPILSVGDSVENEVWELILVDDYYEGAAGEWGTDNLSAVEIFQEFWDNRPETPGGIQCTPAGGATGDIEISLSTDAEIVAMGRPEIDADANLPNEVTVILAASSSSTAAHS